MKVELEEFRMEATHLKNQQATIRRLEERCRQLEQQASIYCNSFYMSVCVHVKCIPFKEWSQRTLSNFVESSAVPHHCFCVNVICEIVRFSLFQYSIKSHYRSACTRWVKPGRAERTTALAHTGFGNKMGSTSLLLLQSLQFSKPEMFSSECKISLDLTTEYPSFCFKILKTNCPKLSLILDVLVVVVAGGG